MFWAGTQGNHQNFEKSLLTNKLWHVFMWMKQFFFFNFFKNTKCAFFTCFWVYVWLPHDHIGWATPMPFASINPTNQRTNPWNFHEKILRIGGTAKWAFFSRPFRFFLLHSNEKMSSFWLARMGQNCDQAKHDDTFWPVPNILTGCV